MAGEPETLDMDEPLDRRMARHRYDRMLMLSDGVFAIAITLLSLELRPPEVWSGSLLDLVTGQWRALFGYVFGFVIVGAFWFTHRILFARLRRIDTPATILSLMLLLLVAMAPATAALVAAHGPIKAIRVYLILVSAAGGVQALLWGYAAFVGGLVDATIGRHERITILGRLLVAPVLFGVWAAFQHEGRGPAEPSLLVALAGVILVGRRLLDRRRRIRAAD